MSAKPTEDENLIDRLKLIGQQIKNVSPEVLGDRVRRFRAAQHISIRDLAEKAELSKTSIVRLEQGRGTQAVTLLKVCGVLGLHVERLFEPDSSGELCKLHKRKDDRWFDLAQLGPTSEQAEGSESKKKRPRTYSKDWQMPGNLLRSRLPDGKIIPSVLELSEPSPTRSHVGEEFVYVIEGVLKITIGKYTHKIKQGESICFWSAEPHRYAPDPSSCETVRILSIRVDG